jgi:beta-glucosidase
MAINEVVDERTIFELYYPPFEGAVIAGVGSFMCAYNKVNDE